MANELTRKFRKQMTRQEFKLWLHLRGLRRLGFRFRRQAPIKNFIVDFVFTQEWLSSSMGASTLSDANP